MSDQYDRIIALLIAGIGFLIISGVASDYGLHATGTGLAIGGVVFIAASYAEWQRKRP